MSEEINGLTKTRISLLVSNWTRNFDSQQLFGTTKLKSHWVTDLTPIIINFTFTINFKFNPTKYVEITNNGKTLTNNYNSHCSTLFGKALVNSLDFNLFKCKIHLLKSQLLKNKSSVTYIGIGLGFITFLYKI